MLEEVVDCTIIAPSPFLSEGVISMEDEPPVEDPQEKVNEPRPLVHKLQVECIPYTSSLKRSLKEIQLLEFDGVDQGKERSEFKKKRCMESTCAREGSLCSRRKLLKKMDGSSCGPYIPDCTSFSIIRVDLSMNGSS